MVLVPNGYADAPMRDPVDVLGNSTRHLRDIVEGLETSQLDAPAYPAEWTIADVLSHLGSGAVLLQRWLEDALAARETPSDLAPSVWAEWNAKSSSVRCSDALLADKALLERLGSVTEAERASFRFVMGPINEDFDGFVGLRLKEHALHTWDIEVSFVPSATLDIETTAIVVDQLELIVRFTGKPAHSDSTVTVRTNTPRRDFSVTLGPDAVSLTPSELGAKPNVQMSAEALVRLVYGRLDPEHTPPVESDIDLDNLRQAFPGP
ncbi:MAG TPA: maleylpyruvate isomerase N-terminal domain-containing protein [Acidimicrobiales bacterium]